MLTTISMTTMILLICKVFLSVTAGKLSSHLLVRVPTMATISYPAAMLDTWKGMPLLWVLFGVKLLNVNNHEVVDDNSPLQGHVL